MCCIIYKPKGVELPKGILDSIREINHDGYGYCTPTDSFKSISYQFFKRRLNKCDMNEPMLIHFRWATHGSVCKSNCHPFFDKDTKTYFMHNGVLPISSVNDMTDSEIAFREDLVPYLGFGTIHSKIVANAVNKIIGHSRFALMRDGDVHLFGQWFLKYGCYFSNLRFDYNLINYDTYNLH